MNKIIIVIIGFIIGYFWSYSAKAESTPLCQVQVCNRIHRLSLNMWNHFKDSMGENCFDVTLPKNKAVVGTVLSEESRWWQGSTINPTKKSVTKVAKVYGCN